jgi:hypothetical protein
MKPIRLRAIRSAAWAIAISAAAVVVASRVNRTPLIPSPPRYAILDENIPEVDLDTRTFRKAVDSLAKNTRAKLVIDPGLLPLLYLQDTQAASIADQPKASKRVRNRSLKAILASLLDQWRDQLQVEYQVDSQTITFFDSNLPPRSRRRIYNLRHLASDWEEWHSLTQSWKPPPSPPGPQRGGLFGGRFVTHPEKPEIQSAQELVELFRESVLGDRSARFYLIANWDGVVIVEAPIEFQIQFQKFLVAWTKSVSLAEGGKR